MGWLRKLERVLLVLGLLMLGVYVGARVHAIFFSRAELQRFKSRAAAAHDGTRETRLLTRAPDFALWSTTRIREYQESLAAQFSPAIGVLRIPKIALEVPVLDGTDDLTLNRGVGLIEGTARPGENGNVGLAGHRDGFFRGLKDVAIGDVIEIDAPDETSRYVIDRIAIVQPTDTSVLEQHTGASLTLVTCYPFYFVGSAPQRYIVQASAINTDLKTMDVKRNASLQLERDRSPK